MMGNIKTQDGGRELRSFSRVAERMANECREDIDMESEKIAPCAVLQPSRITK